MIKNYLSILFLFVSSLVFSQSQDKNILVQSLKSEVDFLKQVNRELNLELNLLKSRLYEESTGAFYRVELGGMDDTAQYLNSSKWFNQEVIDGNKLVCYLRGYDKPNEAHQFAMALRKLNLSSAKVTKYVNGIKDFYYRYFESTTNNESYINQVPSYPRKMSRTMFIED